MKLLLMCLILTANAFATCDTALNIEFFNRTDVAKNYEKKVDKIKKELTLLNFDLSDRGEKYQIDISAGVMKEEVKTTFGKIESQSLIISEIEITNRHGEVVHNSIKTKKVKGNLETSTEKILKVVKRHIIKKVPFCTRN
jgi:hypothetical protein